MSYLLFSLLSGNFDCYQIPENTTLTNHSLADFRLHDKHFINRSALPAFSSHCSELRTVLSPILHLFGSCHQWEASQIPGAKLHPSLGWLWTRGSGQKKQPCADQQPGLQRPSLGLGSRKTGVLLRAGYKMLLMSFKFMLQKSKSSNFTLWLFSWIPMLSQTQRWFVADEEFSQVSPGSCKRFQKEGLSRL